MSAAVWRALSAIWNRPLLGPAQDGAPQMRPAVAYGRRTDARLVLAIAAVFAILAGAADYGRATLTAPVLHLKYGYNPDATSKFATYNLLFDADVPQYSDIATKWWAGNHGYISQRHPLMSLYEYLPTKVFRTLGADALRAVNMTAAMYCALAASLTFLLLVLWGLPLLDAALYTALSQVSASALFFFPIPESYPVAVVTILATLILSMWPQRVAPVARYTAAIALTFSVTVTNAVFGIFPAARNLAMKHLWVAGVSAWFIVCMLWIFEKLLFPHVEFFMPPHPDMLAHIAFSFDRIGAVLRTMLSTVMVMPDFSVMSGAQRVPVSSAYQMMTVQHASLGGPLTTFATASWLALLGLGLWAARKAPSGMAFVSLASAGFLILFHPFFGPETFLYTLHILPFLIVLAAGVSFTRLRWLGVSLAAVTMVAGGLNNWSQLRKAHVVIQDVDAYARTFPAARLNVDFIKIDGLPPSANAAPVKDSAR